MSNNGIMSNDGIRYEIREIDDLDMDIGTLLKELNKDVSCLGIDWDKFILHYKYNPNHSIYVMTEKAGFLECIIGCATLLIEPKIIHYFGKVGHIEDVVIHPDYQGKGLGKILVNDLIKKAREANCYKVILDCNQSNVAFYEKCGMKQKSIGMAIYF